MERRFGKTETAISAAGIALLCAVFVHWLINSDYGIWGRLAALLSAAMFAAVCLRFVPRWTDFWRKSECADAPAPNTETSVPALFAKLLLFDAGVILAVYALRCLTSGVEPFSEYLGFWRCTDSQHYLDIARDWYLSEGEHDRLVQLVFLPGYPIVVRAAAFIVGDYLIAGLLVSGLCFAGAGCLLYKLLLQDCESKTALRAVRYLCLLPGSFFFAAPMSESLFLLLCLGCLYLVRRGKYLPGAVCGALAAFTRSLGVVLLVPLLFELVHDAVRRRAVPRDFLALLIVPLGFAAYCLINYAVAGDAFKFMEYQREHWSQQIGWFFNTAAYQTENLLSAGKELRLGLWLPNLLACFGSLAVVFAAAKRLRASYTAYYLAYFVSAIGATWLLSAPRYLAAMFTVPLAFALVSENKKADVILSVLAAIGGVLYLCAFTLRWQVW